MQPEEKRGDIMSHPGQQPSQYLQIRDNSQVTPLQEEDDFSIYRAEVQPSPDQVISSAKSQSSVNVNEANDRINNLSFGMQPNSSNRLPK